MNDTQYIWCMKGDRECRIHIDVCKNTKCSKRKKCTALKERIMDGDKGISKAVRKDIPPKHRGGKVSPSLSRKKVATRRKSRDG